MGRALDIILSRHTYHQMEDKNLQRLSSHLWIFEFADVSRRRFQEFKAGGRLTLLIFVTEPDRLPPKKWRIIRIDITRSSTRHPLQSLVDFQIVSGQRSHLHLDLLEPAELSRGFLDTGFHKFLAFFCGCSNV